MCLMSEMMGEYQPCSHRKAVNLDVSPYFFIGCDHREAAYHPSPVLL